MIRTPLCDLLGVRYPIIQGGMAWIATGELAAAVSNGGGLGVIGGGNCPPEYVRQQLQLARRFSDRPIGVNIPLFSQYVEAVIETCIAEKVPVVFTGAGNPAPYVPRLKQAGILVIPVVASVALAKRLERSGVDAIVAEGMESGGHIGDVTTFPLVPQVVDAVKLPVIAAGGIADGRGLAAALALGAQGVQMGTRFVCTSESIAHANYKAKIIAAGDRATVTTGHSVGHPVRAIRNQMTRKFTEMENSSATPEEILTLGVGKLRLAVVDGDVENGSVMAGQCAGMVNDILPAAEIIINIVRQAAERIRQMQQYAVIEKN